VLKPRRILALPNLLAILNIGIALVAIVWSLLLWDLEWRTGEAAVRFMVIVFAVVGILAVLPVRSRSPRCRASRPKCRDANVSPSVWELARIK